MGNLDPHYATFALTSSVSSTPITQYIPIPIPYSSPSLPHSLFIHQDTPRQYSTWKSKNYPLTCWHITHFPFLKQTNKSYSCIGFARCHGVFDGVAAAMIVNALVCEMTGQTWTVPPPPSPGININPIQELLDRAVTEYNSEELQEFSGYTTVGITGALKIAAWHTRERWWHNAQRRIFIIPGPVFSRLLDNARASLPPDVEDISTGDILVAWLMKVCILSYS